MKTGPDPKSLLVRFAAEALMNRQRRLGEEVHLL
jgi:hypothetical protein